MGLILALCFAFGGILGSFLGVCVYRIPMGRYEPVRKDLPISTIPVSLISPRRSFCPRCTHQLRWYHTVPIISWIALRGRCAFCQAPIPLRYCTIELLTGLFATLCYLRFGLTPTACVAFVVVCALIVITYIDLDYMIIPNVITYPGTFTGLMLGLASSYLPLSGYLPLDRPFSTSFLESALGVLSGAGTLLAIWWFYLVVRKREGLGLGDVKLLAMLGALFGYQCSIFTIFLGSVFGSVVGLSMIALKRHSFSNYLSFGPYLVAAAIVYIFNFADLIAHLRNPAYATIWRAFQ
jgi:leader peptidase (prepilin peptidase)/N-methyltransferase